MPAKHRGSLLLPITGGIFFSLLVIHVIKMTVTRTLCFFPNDDKSALNIVVQFRQCFKIDTSQSHMCWKFWCGAAHSLFFKERLQVNVLKSTFALIQNLHLAFLRPMLFLSFHLASQPYCNTKIIYRQYFGKTSSLFHQNRPTYKDIHASCWPKPYQECLFKISWFSISLPFSVQISISLCSLYKLITTFQNLSRHWLNHNQT